MPLWGSLHLPGTGIMGITIPKLSKVYANTGVFIGF